MKLRIAPLLANKLAAPAALGLPLLLRCGAAASSLPVALAIAIAKTHRNENGITSCFSPRSTCANASSPCIILSDVTTIGYGRIRYRGLSIRMGKKKKNLFGSGALARASFSVHQSFCQTICDYTWASKAWVVRWVGRKILVKNVPII